MNNILAIPPLFIGSLMASATDNLVSYWALENNLNDTADAGSSTDNGSWVGASDYDPGKFGQAIETKGNTWVSVPDSADLRGSSNTISISSWLRVVTFDQSWQALIAKGENSNWRIARRSGTSEIAYAGGAGDISGGSVNDGAWHHVLGVSEAGVSTRLYIDGVLVDTGSAPNITDSGLDLLIGNNPERTGRGWKGLIDDVGIFNKALNPHEAAAIYTLGNDAAYGFNLEQINDLIQLAADPAGDTLQVGNFTWTSVDSNPNDGRAFVQLENAGGGVAGSSGPTIFSFTADHATVPPGTPITVNWHVDADASNLIILAPGVGNVKPQTINDRGSYTFTSGFTESTTISISAIGNTGTNSREIPITITNQPIIEFFTATPTIASPGDAVTIEWSTLNTTSVSLDGAPVATSGSFVVNPTSTTSYTLSTTNANGITSQDLTIPVIIPGEPIISEFLAVNDGVLLDEDNDASDWIQISNSTNVDSVINGEYYLTDDKDNLQKWQIPSQTLSPGSSVRYFASNKTGTVEPHINFSLASEGEYLALVKVSGGVTTILSEFDEYPDQFTDISYGVLPDLATYVYYKVPTPNDVNTGTTFVDYVRDTNFSIGRGLYTTAQTVAVTSNTSDVAIYYTTDGSEPSPSNGTLYTGPLTFSDTTVLRVIGTKESYIPTNIDTNTYIFPAQVVNQPSNPSGWPGGSVNGQVMDYHMDPGSAVSSSEQGVIDALNAIPTWSIVTDQDNLTGSANGIYVRPGNRGIAWERPASVEMILPPGYISPDGHTEGFQAEAGIRIRGGASRSTSNPKHAFRVFFRREYGQRSLNFPLFGNEGTDEYKGIDLRTAQNYSWSFKRPGSLTANGDNSSKNTFLREVFARDTQRDLGELYTRSRYVHLYLNGLYWGLFMTQERSEAEFAASYLGGSDDDYDTVKSAGSSGGYQTEMTDGNNGDWIAGYEIAKLVETASPTSNTAYFQLQGLNSSGVRDPSLPIHIDVDNLIHYILTVFYNGSFDAPLSTFINASNNWYGVRNRSTDDTGWKFFAHDMEHSLGSYFTARQDRTGPFAFSNRDFSRSNPQYIHQFLMTNNEYRLRFADLTHKHFFNGGVFDDSSVLARFEERENTVNQVIDAEAARWGDSKRSSNPLDRTEWALAVAQLKGWTDGRNDEVKAQLVADDLYPTTEPPVFNQHGGQISSGFILTMTNPNGGGTVYYTTDGSDPRNIGGGINGSASSGGSVVLNSSSEVKARVRINASDWSALTSAEFLTAGPPAANQLVISEINYHPYDLTTTEINAGITDEDEFEFIEIHNTSASPIDLSNVSLGNEVVYNFSDILEPADRVLPAGGRIVVVENSAAFAVRYPGVAHVGPWTGGLSNNNGTVDLLLNGTTLLFSVSYDDNNGWPESADGDGPTLVLINNATPNDPASWRLSTTEGGNPLNSDSEPFIGNANSDDNGNGIDNLIEGVLRDGAGNSVAPEVTIQSFDDGTGSKDYLYLNLRRYLPVDNATVVVEHAGNLLAWDDAAVELVSSTPAGDGSVFETYRYTVPVADDEKHFMRVKVVLD
ncbi:MAG: LamG-like jellyroll fold domain-containing protein [Akkermansiaceae bacterium]